MGFHFCSASRGYLYHARDLAFENNSTDRADSLTYLHIEA